MVLLEAGLRVISGAYVTVYMDKIMERAMALNGCISPSKLSGSSFCLLAT
jgi:hypothetical protein